MLPQRSAGSNKWPFKRQSNVPTCGRSVKNSRRMLAGWRYSVRGPEAAHVQPACVVTQCACWQRQIWTEICRHAGRCVFPLYHSVTAPPWGLVLMLAVGEGGALPTLWRLGSPRVDFPPCIGQAIVELRRTLRHNDANLGLLESLGCRRHDSPFHQATPSIQPSISATFRSWSVRLGLKYCSRLPHRSLWRSHSAVQQASC